MTEQSDTNLNVKNLLQIDTVLVVDDDENWCFLSRKILQRAGVGAQIVTVHNGLAAVNYLQATTAKGEKLPDLIFLDIKMPVMDGFEFLNEIATSAELDLSRTRIFICSSSFHPKDLERAKLYQISGFITKPLTQEILADILK